MDADNHRSRFDRFFNLMLEQISFAMLKFFIHAWSFLPLHHDGWHLASCASDGRMVSKTTQRRKRWRLQKAQNWRSQSRLGKKERTHPLQKTLVQLHSDRSDSDSHRNYDDDLTKVTHTQKPGWYLQSVANHPGFQFESFFSSLLLFSWTTPT